MSLILQESFDEGPQQNQTKAVYSMIEKAKYDDSIDTGMYEGAQVFTGTLNKEFKMITPKYLCFKLNSKHIQD